MAMRTSLRFLALVENYGQSIITTLLIGGGSSVSQVSELPRSIVAPKLAACQIGCCHRDVRQPLPTRNRWLAHRRRRRQEIGYFLYRMYVWSQPTTRYLYPHTMVRISLCHSLPVSCLQVHPTPFPPVQFFPLGTATRFRILK